MFKPTYITCIIWISVSLMAISLVESGPVDENEIKKGRECKTFCGSCGCIGFYCGEECICECNEEKNDDTECIASIQARAKKNKIPFEILIQGPSANRFLKNALQFDQNQQQCSKGDTGRSKRSTVVIYKPAASNSLDENGYCEKPMEKADILAGRKQFFRGKRAIDVDSWFTDFSNTLVKPAPLRGKAFLDTTQEVEEDDVEAANGSAVESDETEFLPKIRGRIRTVLKEKPITKAVKKITDKALKATELDKPVKKFRGAISSLRNRAEEILLPSAEVPESDYTNTNANVKATTGRRLLNKLRGRINRYFAEDDGIVS